VRTGKANPLDAGNGVHCLEQRREVALWVVGRLVVIDDLPEEVNLLPPGGHRLFHLPQDLLLRPHALVPPGIRDHAERAVVVAALEDRHVCPDGVRPPGQPQGKTDIIVGVHVHLSLPRRGLFHQDRQLPRGLCSDHHVHVRGPLEDLAALLLGDAACHSNQGTLWQAPQFPQA